MPASNRPAADEPTAAANSVDRLLDLLVYAPIGLGLDAEQLGPDLARRGRRHSAAARQIGEFAVKAGVRRIDQTLSRLVQTTAGLVPDVEAPDVEAPDVEAPNVEAPNVEVPNVDAAEEVAEGRTPEPVEPDVPAVEDLAIPDYDSLAASQVVKRLGALAPDELESLRQYESAGRDRRTILHKIARLQS